MEIETLPVELECVTEARRARVLIHPLRRQILEHAQTPVSSREVAERMGFARQKVHYHLQELFKSRFLRRAGTRQKRNLVEQRYVATARAYVLSPEILGRLRGDRSIADSLSAAFLLSTACQVQTELGQAAREAAKQKRRLSTLSVNSELRFESREQRAQFTKALEEAVVTVIACFTSPFREPDGDPAPGRPYRLVVGCYPIPRKGHDSEGRARPGRRRERNTK